MGWNISLPDAECYLPEGLALSTVPEGAQKLTSGRLESIINEVMDQKDLSLDTETTGLVIWRDKPLFWSLSWGERRMLMPTSTMPFFSHVFRDPHKNWIFVNAKYDCHMLNNFGVELAGNLVDVGVMHALLYEEQPHGLKDMAHSVLGWRWTDFEDTFGRIKEEGPGPLLLRMWEENPSKLIDYASNDAYGTFKLYLKLRQELEDVYTHSLYPEKYATLWDIFRKIEVPFTRVLFSCEREGVRVDTPYLERTEAPMQKELESIEREINKVSGMNLNPNSPVQLRTYFIDKCGLHPLAYTKGGKSGVRQPSVDFDFLDHYQDQNPVAKLCLAHRDLAKVLGTYVKGLRERLDPNGRVHTRFNQDIARTGRLSSSDPNMQNIPKPESDRFKLRKAFIAREGYDLIVADYEQLEMRLLAAASGEEDMINIIKNKWDIHMGNAALVFGESVARKLRRATPYGYEDFKNAKAIDKKVKAGEMPFSALTDEVQELLRGRDAAKTIGFGLNYGMKENKLARSLGCTKEEALALMDQYMARYPAVKRFFAESVESCRKTGYSFTILGRRRFLPDIDSSNDMDRWKAERQAGNNEIQGSAADVVKMAMILLYEDPHIMKNLGAKMLLQVHDEIMFECPKENSKEARDLIKEWMEHSLPTDLDVPLDASAGIGANWLEAK